MTVHGIAGNHGVIVWVVERVPEQGTEPKIMPCVEVQIVQAMLLSKWIVTPIVVLVNQRPLSNTTEIFLFISMCLFQ